VVPVVVQRLDEPSTEEVIGATGAAIANAFFDAARISHDTRARQSRARREARQSGLLGVHRHEYDAAGLLAAVDPGIKPRMNLSPRTDI
jgi:hypothetical protein